MPPSRRSTSKYQRPRNDGPCTICGKMITYKSDMQRHNKRHAPNVESLKVRCPAFDCKYKNLQRHNVYRHAKKRHISKSNPEPEVYFCSFSDCTFCTFHPADLELHVKYDHGAESENKDDCQETGQSSRVKRRVRRIAPVLTEMANAVQASQPLMDLVPPPQGCGIAGFQFFPLPFAAALQREAAYPTTAGVAYKHGKYEHEDGINVTSVPTWMSWDQQMTHNIPATAAHTYYPQLQGEAWVPQPIAPLWPWNPVLQHTLSTPAPESPASFSNSRSSSPSGPSPVVGEPQTWLTPLPVHASTSPPSSASSSSTCDSVWAELQTPLPVADAFVDTVDPSLWSWADPSPAWNYMQYPTEVPPLGMPPADLDASFSGAFSSLSFIQDIYSPIRF